MEQIDLSNAADEIVTDEALETVEAGLTVGGSGGNGGMLAGLASWFSSWGFSIKF
jgi:hypothetical protein